MKKIHNNSKSYRLKKFRRQIRFHHIQGRTNSLYESSQHMEACSPWQEQKCSRDVAKQRLEPNINPTFTFRLCLETFMLNFILNNHYCIFCTQSLCKTFVD